MSQDEEPYILFPDMYRFVEGGMRNPWPSAPDHPETLKEYEERRARLSYFRQLYDARLV